MRGATGEGEGHEGWTAGAVGEEGEEGVSDNMVKYQDHWEMKAGVGCTTQLGTDPSM